MRVCIKCRSNEFDADTAAIVEKEDVDAHEPAA